MRWTRRQSPWPKRRYAYKRCACGADIGFEYVACYACVRARFDAHERAKALPVGAQLTLAIA